MKWASLLVLFGGVWSPAIVWAQPPAGNNNDGGAASASLSPAPAEDDNDDDQNNNALSIVKIIIPIVMGLLGLLILLSWIWGRYCQRQPDDAVTSKGDGHYEHKQSVLMDWEDGGDDKNETEEETDHKPGRDEEEEEMEPFPESAALCDALGHWVVAASSSSAEQQRPDHEQMLPEPTPEQLALSAAAAGAGHIHQPGRGWTKHDEEAHMLHTMNHSTDSIMTPIPLAAAPQPQSLSSMVVDALWPSSRDNSIRTYDLSLNTLSMEMGGGGTSRSSSARMVDAMISRDNSVRTTGDVHRNNNSSINDEPLPLETPSLSSMMGMEAFFMPSRDNSVAKAMGRDRGMVVPAAGANDPTTANTTAAATAAANVPTNVAKNLEGSNDSDADSVASLDHDRPAGQDGVREVWSGTMQVPGGGGGGGAASTPSLVSISTSTSSGASNSKSIVMPVLIQGEPTERDVKAGQGKGPYEWPGNVAMRAHCAELLDQYNAAKKGAAGKTLLAQLVVKRVYDLNGRFVKPEEQNGQIVWREFEPQQAMKKVWHTFRDLNDRSKNKAFGSSVAK